MVKAGAALRQAHAASASALDGGRGAKVADTGDPARCHADDDALSIPVRELCHDLLESAATIGLLAQAADMEAGPAVTPESQLQGQLRLITAAADQITTICVQVLDQLGPFRCSVIEPLCEPGVNNSTRAARHEGGPSH